MKLDLDCIRDILLEAEKCEYNESLSVRELERLLAQYPKNVVRYNGLKLYEAGYITASCIDVDNSNPPHMLEITDITYSGHQFLASIRDDAQWKGVKKGLSAVRNFSLSAITALSEGMTSAAISAYLSGLTNH